jgi:hypothetical protein
LTLFDTVASTVVLGHAFWLATLLSSTLAERQNFPRNSVFMFHLGLHFAHPYVLVTPANNYIIPAATQYDDFSLGTLSSNLDLDLDI